MAEDGSSLTSSAPRAVARSNYTLRSLKPSYGIAVVRRICAQRPVIAGQNTVSSSPRAPVAHSDNGNLAQQDFIRILNAAGLPTTFRLYDLRHMAATFALAAGVPPKVVSEMLGHTSAAFILDVYSHVLPHMQDSAV